MQDSPFCHTSEAAFPISGELHLDQCNSANSGSTRFWESATNCEFRNLDPHDCEQGFFCNGPPHVGYLDAVEIADEGFWEIWLPLACSPVSGTSGLIGLTARTPVCASCSETGKCEHITLFTCDGAPSRSCGAGQSTMPWGDVPVVSATAGFCGQINSAPLVLTVSEW